MKLLLDTHVLIWWALDEQLGEEARAAIASPDNEAVLSAISVLETEIKVRTGKLRLTFDLRAEAWQYGFTELALTGEHAAAAGRLPTHHRDPFDRVLIGQALVEGMTVVTRDAMFRHYDVPLIDA